IFVTYALVIGDGRAYPIALICPNWSLLRVEMPQLPNDATPEELARREDVHAFVAREVHKQTHGLATYEQIRRVVVIPYEFSVEGGELSPSMKVKRRVVEARYAAEIERAYGEVPAHAGV
ncbi:MAG: long-chain fatty acid--CoA ligase, partial [Candidatus Eremiobacteraeota bacterium]|nr:long-chain fatty acid--CoA ligase [Candidatus Eremiobacteraeota bacterium]